MKHSKQKPWIHVGHKNTYVRPSKRMCLTHMGGWDYSTENREFMVNVDDVNGDISDGIWSSNFFWPSQINDFHWDVMEV